MGNLTGMDIERIKEMFDEPRTILTGVPVGEYKHIHTVPLSVYNYMPVSAFENGMSLLKINGTGIIRELHTQLLEYNKDTVLEIQFVVDGEIVYRAKNNMSSTNPTNYTSLYLRCESPTGSHGNGSYFYPFTFLFRKSLEIKALYIQGSKTGNVKVGHGVSLWYKELGGQQ